MNTSIGVTFDFLTSSLLVRSDIKMAVVGESLVRNPILWTRWTLYSSSWRSMWGKTASQTCIKRLGILWNYKGCSYNRIRGRALLITGKAEVKNIIIDLLPSKQGLLNQTPCISLTSASCTEMFKLHLFLSMSTSYSVTLRVKNMCESLTFIKSKPHNIFFYKKLSYYNNLF